jgi:polyhydroxyalkanoate synthase
MGAEGAPGPVSAAPPSRRRAAGRAAAPPAPAAAAPPPRRRGRPPKAGVAGPFTDVQRPRRGRPPKALGAAPPPPLTTPTPRPRGRPPKAKAPAPAPTASPRDEAPSTKAPRAAAPPDPFDLLTADQKRAMETLSVNLAKAALTANAALAEAAMEKSGRVAAPAGDPFHIGPALGQVMGRLALDPERVMRAQADLYGRYLDLWAGAARRAAGEETRPAASPAKGDKRFNDPDWSANPVFDVVKQSYLITSDWLNRLVSDVQGVDPLTKRRVEFFTKMLTDAFAPTNFLLSNPVALREAVASQGQSLLKGAENFAADLQRGRGHLAISQTDLSRFKVGENIATAPGKVVARTALFELLQFAPTTDKVHETPLLIFPPWINKYYILDLRPENSMIRWLTDQGFTVFVTSWVNPDGALARKSFEDYLFEGVYRAVDEVLTQTGTRTVNAVGYCIGGTLLSCALAHMAARGDERVASATFFAAQQDFSEAGDLLIFTDDAWLKDLEERIDAAGGVSPAAAMADTFNSLRANDLIWSFFVNNYLLGREPAPFDLLFWNSDQTRMPKALHLSYLRDFYRDNRLAKTELTLGGELLDLGAVKTPIFVQSSREDHIAPLRSVYKGARLFGGEVRFTLAGSGHIAGVINPPAAGKYQHWVNPELPESVEAWQAGASERPGSWWPSWRDWLETRSGPLVPARDPAAGPLAPLEDAPGSYVKVRSTT